MQRDSNIYPAFSRLVYLALSGLGLTLASIFWLYFTGSRALSVQAREHALSIQAPETIRPRVPQISTPTAISAPDPEKSASLLLAQVQGWTLKVALTTAIGTSGIVLLVLVPVYVWRRRGTNQAPLSSLPGQSQRPVRPVLSADDLNLQLKSQQLQSRQLQQQLETLQNQFDKRIEERTTELKVRSAQLEEELNERKQMERALAQQAQELGRSKDVLEMHVQARTQELQKLQRRYEHILNSAGEGIYGLDLQGRTTFVNPAAAKLTGWKVEETVSKLEHEIFLGGQPTSLAIALDPQDNQPSEAVFYRKDGSSFLVESVRTPILDNNRPVGTVVLFKDITDRKRTEEALARKASELARSNAELEQFAYVASHDLQEPLRKIQAFGDRLKTKVDASKLQEGRDYLERMQSAAARMQRLINDLLTFSRVISATQPFVPVDLGQITREVLTDLEVRIEQTKAQIEVGPLPTIEADPMQMRQLLQNLIGNALKFQQQGAKPIVSIQAQFIKAPTTHPRPDEAFCELRIQDNGIGFDEKYKDKIFAMFQRLHGRSEYEGTGVGLAVCRRITDRHSGSIDAISKPGEGATFVITLPACHPLPAANPETTKPEARNITKAEPKAEATPLAA